ncbi:MAG: type II toxin-antitoxin system HicA family toxin [Planctomycetota bacterium]
MKRRVLLKALSAAGCRHVREGGRHTIWESADGLRRAAVPRHTEIPLRTATAICRQLDVEPPAGS